METALRRLEAKTWGDSLYQGVHSSVAEFATANDLLNSTDAILTRSDQLSNVPASFILHEKRSQSQTFSAL